MIINSGLKKNEFQLALGKSYFAFSIQLADDLLAFLPTRQVRLKSYLPRRKMYLSRTMGQHFFQALI